MMLFAPPAACWKIINAKLVATRILYSLYRPQLSAYPFRAQAHPASGQTPTKIFLRERTGPPIISGPGAWKVGSFAARLDQIPSRVRNPTAV